MFILTYEINHFFLHECDISFLASSDFCHLLITIDAISLDLDQERHSVWIQTVWRSHSVHNFFGEKVNFEKGMKNYPAFKEIWTVFRLEIKPLAPLDSCPCTINSASTIIFHAFAVFKIKFFKKFFKDQMVWIQISTDFLSVLVWVQIVSKSNPETTKARKELKSGFWHVG